MRGIVLTKLTVLLLNAAVVIAGSLIGSNLKKVIRKDVLDGVMIGSDAYGTSGVITRVGRQPALFHKSFLFWKKSTNGFSVDIG